MPRYFLMISLVVAGELVFGLPFNIARVFRPTLLEVFGFTNTQLGDLFAVYGITALLGYLPGGALADRFSARSLMSFSLFSTAAGGIYMATIPGAVEMAVLYGYWGVTTIFLFWGALIRATREWGGDNSQGLAFGILEGGRGLVAAIVAFVAVNLFAFYMPENANLATEQQRVTGFRTIILYYSAATFLAGLFTWYTIPVVKRARRIEYNPLQGMGLVLRKPILWAQAGIIVCAYCCFKGLDNYSLYAVQVLGMDEVEGARLAVYGGWTRPVAAVIAGLIADRFNATRLIGFIFVSLFVSYGTWSMMTPAGSGVAVIYVNFFVSFFAVYALRGIYFALREETRTPKFLTGAAVGMISLVGYTPEIFFAPIAGRILDANPGIVGHQNYFMFLAAIAVFGVSIALWLLWMRRPGAAALWHEEETGAGEINS